jgi:hypothetical protein
MSTCDGEWKEDKKRLRGEEADITTNIQKPASINVIDKGGGIAIMKKNN